MTEKRFERIYADVDVFCRDHNAKEVSQLIGREDYDRIVGLLNEQHEQIERLKMNFRALEEVKCELADENEQLKSTIAQLIEQNRKNNDLLLSDIRILEKALWCSGCANNYGRLKELRKEFIGDVE